MSDAVPLWMFVVGFGIGLGTMIGAVIILGVAHAVSLLRLPAIATEARRAETENTGSVHEGEARD